MVWFDTFGKLLTKGVDIVYGTVTEEGAKLESGIVHETGEDVLWISYNTWNDGEEFVHDVFFYKKDYPTGVVQSIYKIIY
ncbi:MAG: hypothetical protein J6Y37_01990 [Paludibacteraceae bacterium]|nr:hypothetical protein [Paludibacteraceae bacterium]